MIRRNQAFLNKLNILLDIALTVAAYILASWLRLDFLDGQETNMAAVSGRTVLLALSYSLVLFLLLSVMGFYNTLIATALLFTFRLMDFSRGVLIVFYLSTVSLLVGKYALTRLIFNHYRKKGYNLKHVLVIGTGSLAEQYQRDIEEESELGFSIMGFIGDHRLLRAQRREVFRHPFLQRHYPGEPGDRDHRPQQADQHALQPAGQCGMEPDQTRV